MLADIPVPQRQLQALGAYQADGADGNRRGRLPAGLVRLHTDREPPVGVKAAVSAPGVPDDPGPRGLIAERPPPQRILRPDQGPVLPGPARRRASRGVGAPGGGTAGAPPPRRRGPPATTGVSRSSSALLRGPRPGRPPTVAARYGSPLVGAGRGLTQSAR